MDRLEENLKRIMQVASVIGREFAFRILQSITEMREGLKSHLLNLQGLEFIYEKSLFPELEYVFKHALTQEVAYNSLLLKRRQDLHTRIARAIEELYAPDRIEEFDEMLAYHYSRGEDLENACKYLTLSGNKAFRLHSPREAYGFYKDALATLRRLPETEERKNRELDAILLTAQTLTFVGYPEESLGMLHEGETLAKELQDTRRLARIHNWVGTYHTFHGNHPLGMRYSEDAFQEGRKAGDVDLAVRAATGLLSAYVAAGQFGRSVATARDVLGLIEDAKRESDFFGTSYNPYAVISSYCGAHLGHMGRFQEGKPFLERALRHASQLDDPSTSTFVEWHYGLFFHTKGDWKAAAEHYHQCIAHGEEGKFVIFLAWGWSMLGNTYAYLGDPEAGRSYGEKGLTMQRDNRLEFLLCMHHLLLGDTHLRRADLENARISLEEAVRLSQKQNEKYFGALAWIILGRVLGRTDASDIRKAEECILQGLNLAEEMKTRPFLAQGYLFLGELHAHGGQKDKALENLTKAETMFQEMGMDYWLAETRRVSAGL
jgi:tetratricopeptide (TPR) repeat protein